MSDQKTMLDSVGAGGQHYSADNSEGARLQGGRWNLPGTPVICTAATRSLAALEVIVHNGAIASSKLMFPPAF